MLEPSWIYTAAWLAALAAAAAGLVTEGRWARPSPGRSRAAWVVGLFAGFIVAGLSHQLLNGAKIFPPRESIHRLLLYVAPLATAVQLLTCMPQPSRWMTLISRGMLVVATPPLLLLSLIRNSWSGAESLAWCAALAAALAAGWLLLARLSARDDLGRAPWLAMIVAAMAGGATLLASGSVALGQMGMSLGLALIGLLAASLAFRNVAPSAGMGLAWLLLASMLIQGHLLAELTPLRAILLALAPMTGTVAAIPAVRNRGPWVQAGASVLAAGVVACITALPALIEAMRAAAGPSVSDYGY